MTEVTIGSLFSGSGGFELAASICGIKPVWASEIEPLPILVTKKNFPETKMAKGTGGPSGDECQNLVSVDYVIRRLTPLECCRLQGFPDNWTEAIAIENPSAKTIREWMIVWAEWWRLVGRADGIQLPKYAKQTERWLADPVSDSALYKMWGNGIALPCAICVLGNHGSFERGGTT